MEDWNKCFLTLWYVKTGSVSRLRLSYNQFFYNHYLCTFYYFSRLVRIMPHLFLAVLHLVLWIMKQLGCSGKLYFPNNSNLSILFVKLQFVYYFFQAWSLCTCWRWHFVCGTNFSLELHSYVTSNSSKIGTMD